MAAPLRVPASQIVSDAAQVAEAELRDLELAHRLWGLAVDLWPDQAEALERRIALDRALDAPEALARDLEAWAGMLLDPGARFEALVEAARLWAGRLKNVSTARPLLAEAIALVEDEPAPPAGLDEARRALRGMQAGEL